MNDRRFKRQLRKVYKRALKATRRDLKELDALLMSVYGMAAGDPERWNAWQTKYWDLVREEQYYLTKLGEL